MMAKRAKADAQDVKNRYATNKRHARGGMNDSKILRGWGAIELYAGGPCGLTLKTWTNTGWESLGICGHLWESVGTKPRPP